MCFFNDGFHLQIMVYKCTAIGVFGFSPGWNILVFKAGWSVHVTQKKFYPGWHFNPSKCNGPLRKVYSK